MDGPYPKENSIELILFCFGLMYMTSILARERTTTMCVYQVVKRVPKSCVHNAQTLCQKSSFPRVVAFFQRPLI